MNRHRMLLISFILSILICTSSSAITINGYIFNDDSASLTNPYFIMEPGRAIVLYCESSGSAGLLQIEGPEIIYGVNCVKWTGGSHTWWLAQDSIGNIHVLRHNEDVVNSDDDIPNLFMPVDPIATDTWSWQMDGFGPILYEVSSTSAVLSVPPAGSYANCLLVSEGAAGDHWQFMYLKHGIGFVGNNTGTLCIRINLSFDSDNDGVPDEWDECSETDPNMPVNEDGCPASCIIGFDQIGLENAITSLQVMAGLRPNLPISTSVAVPKSGQTTSHQTGDDGDLQRGMELPTPRFTDNGNNTVTDNLTGLIWTKNANIYGLKTWSQAVSDCEACAEGGYEDWHLPQVKELYSLIHYGYFYPAVSNTAGTGKWTENDPFTSIQWETASYWTSTSDAYADYYSSEYAWIQEMATGWLTHTPMSFTHFVWCVRGGSN